MVQKAETDLYRVVYSSGGSFYTKAQSGPQFVLDPVFIQFMALSVFMFTSLMMALDIPLVPQVILFGAGLVSTFFLLPLSIILYQAVIQSFGGRTIYTPLLLIPMQALNLMFMDYVLKMFGTSYVDGSNTLWEFSLRTFIILVTLDIFHGKFVAPHHALYVSPHSGENEPALKSAEEAAPTLAARPDAKTIPPQTSDEPTKTDAPQTPNTDEAMAAETPDEPLSSVLKIGSETFDLNAMQFIKSEDHYLFVQQNGQGKLVRGKLRDVAAKIDVFWGLQINRSVWVAYSAIDAAQETSNGRLDVHLTDGSVFRIAETRRVFFLHNANQKNFTWM